MKMRSVLSFAALACALLVSAPSPAQTPSLTFTLETTNPDGKSLIPRLTWSTSPAASGCAASGDWSGTKLAAGTELLAAVTTSKQYTLLCTYPGEKTATVNWTIPSTNVDGTPLTNLAGFRVNYGQAANALTQSVAISSKTQSQWVSGNLAIGRWYFGVVAINSLGVESDLSNIPFKDITADQTQSRTQTLSFTVPSAVVVTVK